jgi:hypothetical protein
MKNYNNILDFRFEILYFKYAIIIFLCFSAFVVRSFSQPPKDSQLALIYFDTDSQLKQADQYGIYILHYLTDLPDLENGLTREDRMIAFITPEQKIWLESNQFTVQVIDSNPDPNQNYYLVQTYIPSGQELTHGLWEHRDMDLDQLAQFGLANEYVYGTYLLRGERIDIMKLKELGYELMRLEGRGYLPWIKPPERKALTESEHQVIQSLVDQVSWSRLSTSILYLQDNDTVAGWDALGSRYVFNTTQWFPKTYYILTTLQSYGLTADYDYFSYSGYTDFRNIVAIQNGIDSSGYYLICAHCDSITGLASSGGPAPGADDNGSGTAAVLECARILSHRQFKYPIRYIAFGAEEEGLIGSAAYANAAYNSGDTIFGVINLDMIAWDAPPYLNVDCIVQDSWAEWLVDAMVEKNIAYNIGLDTVRKIINSSIWQSDHSSFRNRGYSALLGIEQLNTSYYPYNPYYHTIGDTLSTLNMPLFTKFTQLSLATIAELAQVIYTTEVESTNWQLYP